MYKISRKQEQYQTYILSDEKTHSRLEVVPERGGIITRWRIQGQDILYMDAERFANPELSVRGGIPILFPICGNLPEDTYTLNGKQYKLKQHGFARDLPWEVTETEGDDRARITLVLKSSDRTREVYPFDFQLEFTYQIQGNNLQIEQRITNYSQERMPFSLGFHPYFWTNNKNRLNFDIPSSQYRNQITQEVVSFRGMFDFDLEEIDVAFTELQRDRTSIIDNPRRLQISIKFCDLYSTLVFWTVKGKDYICLEPWSAPRNALNTGEQLTYLEPESTESGLVELAVGYL